MIGYRLVNIAATALLIAGLGYVAPGSAQELPSAAYAESIEVRVINLEAVVSDKDGQRISGLGREDFKLLVDGEEVPIKYFTEIRNGRVIESGKTVPELEGAASVGTSFLVFVDDFFPLHHDKQRVLRAVAEQARNMRPGDRVAVVAWEGRNLEMLSDWTSSPQEVAKAIDAAIERPSGGLHRQAEHDQWIDRPPAATVRRPGRTYYRGAYGAHYRLGPQEEIYADQLVAQLATAVGAALDRQ